jgi:hypothetical protein
MSLSLAEALEQVDLEPGQVYTCQVKGHWVELRVLPSGERPKSAGIDELDIMLDPWVRLPRPAPTFQVLGEYGPTRQPYVPEIPEDKDERGDWRRFGQTQLARAFGPDEPEYTEADLRSKDEA